MIKWGPGPALIAVIVASGAMAIGLYVATIEGAADVGDAGRANARALAAWEVDRGLGWTHDLADTWLSAGPLEHFWAIVYSLGYWPFLASAAAWALVFDRRRLQHLVVLVGLTGLVGVVVMTLVPVSPPRLIGASDPIRGTALERFAHPDGLMNEHAAMPSFHVAWSIAAAATLAVAGGPIGALRRIVWLQPVLMTVATLTTGNHWVSDAAAGLVLIVVAWCPARLLVVAARRQFAATRSGVPRPHGDRVGAPVRARSNS